MIVLQCKPCRDRQKKTEWKEWDFYTVKHHLEDEHKIIVSGSAIKDYVREVGI